MHKHKKRNKPPDWYIFILKIYSHRDSDRLISILNICSHRISYCLFSRLNICSHRPTDKTHFSIKHTKTPDCLICILNICSHRPPDCPIFILNTCSHRLIRLHTNPLTRIHINERCFRHWAFASLSINTITKRHNAIINTHNTLKQVTETFFFLSWWAARRREDFCVSRPWGIYTWICFHVQSKTHKQWNRQRYCINDLRSRADIRQKCWALKSITRVTTLTKKPLGGRNSGNHWNLQKQYY